MNLVSDTCSTKSNSLMRKLFSHFSFIALFISLTTIIASQFSRSDFVILSPFKKFQLWSNTAIRLTGMYTERIDAENETRLRFTFSDGTEVVRKFSYYRWPVEKSPSLFFEVKLGSSSLLLRNKTIDGLVEYNCRMHRKLIKITMEHRKFSLEAILDSRGNLPSQAPYKIDWERGCASQ